MNYNGKSIYAYEVDGMGNSLLMDDANVPSLLSMPYLNYTEVPIYIFYILYISNLSRVVTVVHLNLRILSLSLSLSLSLISGRHGCVREYNELYLVY